jgi:hypothetical protein
MTNKSTYITFTSVLLCRAIGLPRNRSSGRACLSNASYLLWLEELPWKRKRAPGTILLATLRNPHRSVPGFPTTHLVQ